NLTVVGIMWFGGLGIDGGNMHIGDLMAFIQYVMQILFAVMMASMMFVIIPRAAVSAKRVNDVLEMEPVLPDDGTEEANIQPGTLEFDDVTFNYPGAEEPALTHISFKDRKSTRLNS